GHGVLLCLRSCALSMTPRPRTPATMCRVTGDWVIDAFGARWSLETEALAPAQRDRLHELWARCRVPGATAGDEGVLPFPVSTGNPYAVSRAVTLASLR